MFKRNKGLIDSMGWIWIWPVQLFENVYTTFFNCHVTGYNRIHTGFLNCMVQYYYNLSKRYLNISVKYQNNHMNDIHCTLILN